MIAPVDSERYQAAKPTKTASREFAGGDSKGHDLWRGLGGVKPSAGIWGGSRLPKVFADGYHAADALRYLVAMKSRTITQLKLRGL